MMKAMFVNGSPRKNWNTHKMLESAIHGAQDAGAESEMMNLYELEAFRGCVSCFACKDEGEPGILDMTIHTAMIYTMGYPNEEGIKKFGCFEMFRENSRFMEQLFGTCETLYAYNTYQFTDYSRYDVMEGIEPMKAKWREEHFPEDLKMAYELGKRLVEKAGGRA